MLLAHSIWDIVSNTQLWTSILDLIICKVKTHIGKVGSDHAGIATQMVVENNLSKNNITRKDLGREKFIKKRKM